jgi:hypothetical protein
MGKTKFEFTRENMRYNNVFVISVCLLTAGNQLTRRSFEGNKHNII